MDISARKELGSVLEQLTHSGSKTLDLKLLRTLKSICRSSDVQVRAAHEIIMKYLSTDHAEVRFSSFQIIQELFSRSHLFRELLISDFKLFSSLVTGTDAHSPLPLPKQVSSQLKHKSLLTIRGWNDKYGDGYPKLRLGYNYLKVNKKVNFDELVAETDVARRRQEERAARQRMILRQKIETIKQEMKDQTMDIEKCMVEIDSCFNLLLPRFDVPDIYSSASNTTATAESNVCAVIPDGKDDLHTMEGDKSLVHSAGDHQPSTNVVSFDTNAGLQSSSREGITTEPQVPSDSNRLEETNVSFSRVHCSSSSLGTSSDSSYSDSESELEWEDVDPDNNRDLDLHEHGIATHGVSIPILLEAVPVLHEDEDNSSILSNLRENKLLLVERLLPTINTWMEWLSKAGNEETTLKSAIDLKHKVQLTLEKFKRVSIIYKEQPSKETETTESTDSDEVKEKQFTVTEPEWEFRPKTVAKVKDIELDPTTPEAQLVRLKAKLGEQEKGPNSSSNQVSVTAKNDLLSTAPVVPFGMDLYHWETPNKDLLPLTKAPVGSLHRFWVQEREVDISSDEQARLRCRTIPYPGTFKPVKRTCRAPLPSGNLCPRMDRHKCPFHGPIVPRNDEGEPVCEEGGASVSQLDPTEQEAVRDKEGEELLQGKAKKAKKTKEKQYPGLSELKVKEDSPRNRLEKKILSKRALKRVADSVDSANAKKYKDKFGYSFNYALSK